MGGNHRPSAPFCRELLTLSQFVMRYFVPADGTFLGDDRAAFMRAGLGLSTVRTIVGKVDGSDRTGKAKLCYLPRN